MGLRIGHGYDVHRLKAGRALRLGGTDIPHPYGLDGHSDADVLTHAVMDALLGAAALGDIGRHFPDSDPVYRNANSMVLLRTVGGLLRNEGYRTENIDATLIAEEPLLSPYRDSMRQNIAAALDIELSRVNVKFTTQEGLGFVGAKEGMAAEAVCLLQSLKPDAPRAVPL